MGEKGVAFTYSEKGVLFLSDLIVLLSMRLSTASYAVFAVHVTWRILLKNHISVTSIFFCSCFQIVQALHPYISRGSTLLSAALLLMWMKMHKFVIIDFHLWEHNCLSYCGYFSGVLVWYKSSQYLHWLLCWPFFLSLIKVLIYGLSVDKRPLHLSICCSIPNLSCLGNA